MSTPLGDVTSGDAMSSSRAWIVVKTRYLHTKWFYTGVAGRNVGIADIVDPSVVCRPVFVRINV
jgi:hypothetical protein